MRDSFEIVGSRPCFRLMVTNYCGLKPTQSKMSDGVLKKNIKTYIKNHVPMIIQPMPDSWIGKTLKHIGAIDGDEIIPGDYVIMLDGVEVSMRLSNDRYDPYNNKWY